MCTISICKARASNVITTISITSCFITSSIVYRRRAFVAKENCSHWRRLEIFRNKGTHCRKRNAKRGGYAYFITQHRYFLKRSIGLLWAVVIAHTSRLTPVALGFLSKSLQFKTRKEETWSETVRGMEAVGEWPFQRRHFAPVEGTTTPRSCQTLPFKVISNL